MWATLSPYLVWKLCFYVSGWKVNTFHVLEAPCMVLFPYEFAYISFQKEVTCSESCLHPSPLPFTQKLHKQPETVSIYMLMCSGHHYSYAVEQIKNTHLCLTPLVGTRQHNAGRHSDGHSHPWMVPCMLNIWSLFPLTQKLNWSFQKEVSSAYCPWDGSGVCPHAILFGLPVRFSIPFGGQTCKELNPHLPWKQV